MNASTTTPRHTVRLTALRTGLTPHILRAWERRYHVVAPARSEGGQRLYSDQDVERLRLLRKLTERGHSIGRLAKSSLADLERMADEEEVPSDRKEAAVGARPEDFRSDALGAARRLDGPELQTVLERATVILGVPGFLDDVAGPVLQQIGDGWRAGTLSVSHEHLATSVFRRVLGWIIGVFEVNGAGPRLVVATPPGQAHELGALMAAAAAATQGWDVIYLGADLPAEEILNAARQSGARAVALSIVLPVDDQSLIQGLQQIRRGLDPDVLLFLGGAAVAQHPEKFSVGGASVFGSLVDFRGTLQQLQEQR